MHLEGLEQIGLCRASAAARWSGTCGRRSPSGPSRTPRSPLASTGSWSGHRSGTCAASRRPPVPRPCSPSAPGPPGPASARCADRPCCHRRPESSSDTQPERERESSKAAERVKRGRDSLMYRSLIEAGAGRRTAHLTGPCQDRNISNGLEPAKTRQQGQELPQPAGPRWFYAYADLQALGSALSGRPGSGNVHIRKSW